MTSKSVRAALTAAFLLGGASVAYAADKPAAPKITSGVAKALSTAQTANTKKDYPAALAAIEQAKAVTDRTAYDNLMIARFSMAVHIGMNDYAAADVDAEAAADTDPAVVPDADKSVIYKPAMQLALNAKHYDKAAKYAKLLGDTTPPPDAATQATMAQAMYLGADYAGATTLAQKNIDAAKAAGTRPARNDLDIIMSSQVKQKDEAGAEMTLEALVQYYNMPEDWGQILGVTLGTKGMTETDYIYVGRLMLASGAKFSANDAQVIGSTANKSALYGDAEAMAKAGGPAPDAREAADKKSIPAQIALGPKQGAEYNVKTAEALYGYGMYADAEKMARDAKAKGATKEPNEADMVIGMSLAAQGKYAEAATVFSGITATNPAKARVVRLWGYYAKSKAAPAAAAPAK
ncbi:MAG: hypothetical protein JWN16_2741 [Alphaproteobacteria bacterium]|nr:hypothetical protein [Alphaproteobacteria bacterium]